MWALLCFIKFCFGICGPSKLVILISLLFAVVLYLISVIVLNIFSKEELAMIPYGKRIYKVLESLGVYTK